MAPLEASIEIKIPFEDIDMLQLVWHGHYAKYFEAARCELLDGIGYTYLDMQEAGVMYPVVDLQFKFVKPIKFGQKIVVTAKLIEWEQLLKLDYNIQDAKSGEQLARGSSTQAGVLISTMELLRKCPAEMDKRVRHAQSKVQS